jgi:hypothetical protein
MSIEHNVIGWVEIPVLNMDRAVKFYETVFEFHLELHHMGSLTMAWFQWKENSIGSAVSLVYHEEFYKPSSDGILVYFTAFSGDLNNELNKVEDAGGKVLLPKTLITEEIGYYAVLLDSEGNRIALHSKK